MGSIVLPYCLVCHFDLPLMHSWALVVTASEHPWAVLAEGWLGCSELLPLSAVTSGSLSVLYLNC